MRASTRGLVAALVLAAACGSREDVVVVGAKNFTEQRILGELVAQTVEAAGLRAERRLDLGGTFVCDAAIRAGQIDLYVEYTGTALTDILKLPAQSDPAAVLSSVREAYRGVGLTLGAPLGFNNTFALVARRDFAESKRLKRISDLAPLAAGLRVGLFGEFLERPDGMPGLVRAYGLRLGVRPREMDLGLLYRALQEDKVDVVVGSATDGLIAAMDLVVLEDDRAYFPPYDAVPVVRTASVERHPGLAAALAALGGRIDAPTMRRLNLAVDGEHRAPADVAREFLRRGATTAR